MNETYRAIIGKNIREARKKKGMTRAQFAEAADLSDVYVAYIEQGKRCPNLDTLFRIATILDVNPSDILSNASSDKSQDTLFSTFDEYERKTLVRFADILRKILNE